MQEQARNAIIACFFFVKIFERERKTTQAFTIDEVTDSLIGSKLFGKCRRGRSGRRGRAGSECGICILEI